MRLGWDGGGGVSKINELEIPFVYHVKLELEPLGIRKPSLTQQIQVTQGESGCVVTFLFGRLTAFVSHRSLVYRKGSLLSRSWLSPSPPETL